MQRLKLGFIGGGLNSAVGPAHRVASQMDGRWELVAGAFSRHPEINDATGTSWGVSADRVYDHWEDLLAAELGQLDAVAVLTPIPSHAEEIDRLLHAGFDVISEKSITGSSAEATSLAHSADQHSRFLAVTFNYSGYPMIRELRARIQAGELGRIQSVQVEMPQESFSRVDATGRPLVPQEWRQHDGSIPTVSLDLGIHTHHLVQFLLGSDPISVVATQAHHGLITEVVDYVSCLAKYPDDVDVNMWFGKCALGNRNGLRIRVYGDLAACEWIQAHPEELRFADRAGNIRILDRATPGTLVAGDVRYMRFKAGHPAGFVEAFANLYWDLADSLIKHQETGESESQFVFGPVDAARGLAMMESMAASAASGVWQQVPRQE